MAFIEEANAASSKFYDKTLTQDVYEGSPFYVKLKAMGNVSTDGGTQITWPIRYRKLEQSGFVGPREQVSYSQKETRTQGVLDWKYHVGQNMISWDEQVKNTGRPQIVKLIDDKTAELREDALDDFATALHAVTPGSDDISSLPQIIDSTTEYAGVPVANAPNFVAVEDTSATELVLFGDASLSYMVNQATFGKSKPDLHLTTRDLWSKFESLIEPQKRYYNKDTALAKAGFTSLQWHDAEIISDVYTQAKYWYGIDTKQFEIRYHPKYNFLTSAWKSLEQAGYPYALAKTCAWAGNIMCRSRRTSFKFTLLDYTK